MLASSAIKDVEVLQVVPFFGDFHSLREFISTPGNLTFQHKALTECSTSQPQRDYGNILQNSETILAVHKPADEMFCNKRQRSTAHSDLAAISI